MTDLEAHKFDAKFEITYSQYIKDTMEGEVALQKELERTLGKEKAHTLLRDWTKKRTVRSMERFIKNKGIQIETFEDFKKVQDEMWNGPHVKHTHTSQTTNDKHDRVTYTVSECIWAKTMQELGAAELGQLTMCDNDFVSASIYHPKIELVRTKTLMNGDDCCDFTYVWKE
ncbi:MAG: L-2-amino-thiazoline-4-carboxylic acid hydrolase [Candidatus Odinarchaeota archaeon]